MLRLLCALHSAEKAGGVTLIELALDSERTLLAAPQAKFGGHPLPLQERARVLKLVLYTLQRLAKSDTLHPAKVITRSAALVPIGGSALARSNTRPYFACRSAMISHMEHPARYFESTWTLARMHAHMRNDRMSIDFGVQLKR